MSGFLDETRHVSKILNTNKIYDLKSQLTLKKRGEDMIALCKKQFINDLFLAIIAISSILIVYFEVMHMQSEEFYREEISTVNNIPVIIKQRNQSNTEVTTLRLVNIGLTLVLCNILYSIFNIQTLCL